LSHSSRSSGTASSIRLRCRSTAGNGTCPSGRARGKPRQMCGRKPKVGAALHRG
jgi:hypothetical protein